MSVIGLIRGMNTPSYQSRPRARMSRNRVRNPAMNGMPEVDEHALRDLADGDVDHDAPEADPGRQDRDEHVREDRVEQDLEDRVEGHQPRGVLGVAAGQVVPHDHHRDAAGEPDQDQTGHVLGGVAQEDHGQREHQQRPDDPVLDQRQGEDPDVAEDAPDLLVADLRQRRVHHQDQADRDRDRGRPDAEPVEERHDPRQQVPERDPARHGREDPDRQIAVEDLEAPARRRGGDGRGGSGHGAPSGVCGERARRAYRFGRMREVTSVTCGYPVITERGACRRRAARSR